MSTIARWSDNVHLPHYSRPVQFQKQDIKLSHQCISDLHLPITSCAKPDSFNTDTPDCKVLVPGHRTHDCATILGHITLVVDTLPTTINRHLSSQYESIAVQLDMARRLHTDHAAVAPTA